MTNTDSAPGRGTPMGVLAAATIGNALGTTAAVHAVFGSFLVPLSEAFGWPRASISAVMALLAISGAIIYPFAGRFADAHGARGMILIGNVILALGIASLALGTGSLPQFYLSFLVISIAGALPSTAILSKIVADWFQQHRGTALGISAGLGNGLGATLLPVLVAIVLPIAGWRAAYLAVAAAVLLIGFPAFFLLLHDRTKTGPGSANQAMTGDDGLSLSEAARLPVFWLILIAIGVGGGVATAIFSHVVPILGDRGFGIGIGTAVVSVFALITSGWQILTGRLLDHMPGPRIVVPMYAVGILGLALLEFAPSTSLLMFGGALMGIAMGTQYGALPFFIARYFGMRHFGVILGVMYSGVMAAQGTTPVLLDAAFDALGSYRTAILVAGACLSMGALLLLMLPRYNRAAAGGNDPMLGTAHG